jgi:hypothetical protein
VAPIPISHRLVPVSVPAVPDGFTIVDEPLASGLPHTVSLTRGLVLVVAVPSGLARAWRDADPAAVVTSSDDEAKLPEGAGELGFVGRAPARLFLERGGSTVASVPLAAGLRRTIPDTGDTGQGALVELMLVSWDIRAGTLRGAGDFGSRLRLGWRSANAGNDEFESPALHPRVEQRLALDGAG